MGEPLVRINVDPAERIAELYGVGPTLAARIVAHREAHGWFHSPEELAQVVGLGLELAITLSPHIDWQAPAPHEAPKARNWGGALYNLVCVMAVGWAVLHRVAPGLRSAWDAYRLGAAGAWTGVWQRISVLAGAVFCVFALSSLVIGALSRDRGIEQRCWRVAMRIVGAMVFAMVSAVLAVAVRYQFYAPGGWGDFLRDSLALRTVFWGVLVGPLFGPPLLVLWKPVLARRGGLARICDAAFVLGAPLMAWSVWTVRGDLPVLWTVWLGAAGLMFAVAGWRTIRTGESFFSFVVGLMWDAETLAGERRGGGGWMAWVNARLPDPEDQKRLKQALEEAYPRSRVRTIVGVIVFAAGSWLVLTALGAVVEWVVQNWLKTLFP